jgi:hypothetical protein
VISRILQFAPGAIAISLIGERHPDSGGIEQNISLQRRARGGGQTKALRRPASAFVSVRH